MAAWRKMDIFKGWLLIILGAMQSHECHSFTGQERVRSSCRRLATSKNDHIPGSHVSWSADASLACPEDVQLIDALENERICNLSDEAVWTEELDLVLDMDDDIEDDDQAYQPINEPISLDDLKSLTTTKNNIAYFYLRNEIGIDEADMWKITNEAGSILGMTATNLKRKIDLMKRLMDLSDDDVRTMLMRSPAVLHLSAKQNVAPTILFLQRSLDLSRQDLRALLVPFPSILGYSLSNLKSKLNFYLYLCQFTKEEARKLFVKEPKLLTAGVQTGLIPRFHFFVAEIKVPLPDLRNIIQKNPSVLLCSVEQNLQRKLIFYLIMSLGMTTDQVQKILKNYPQFLNYNLENHILPITRYFKHDLLFGNPEFVQILLKFPRLITWSLFKIKHVVGYLRFELGMDAAQVKRILYQAPQIINLNTEDTLKKKVEFFRSTFDLTDHELRKILAGMPTLTICSLQENLIPKVEYLKQSFGASGGNIEEELKAAILLQPTLLGYSLEKRIKPRMELLLEAGVPPGAITVGIPQSEQAFESWLNGRRAKVKSDAEAAQQQLVPVDAKSTTDGDSNDRIIHWTRERRRPGSDAIRERL